MTAEIELEMTCHIVQYIQETAQARPINVAKLLAFLNARLMHATETELHVDGVEMGAELQKQMAGAGK